MENLTTTTGTVKTSGAITGSKIIPASGLIMTHGPDRNLASHCVPPCWPCRCRADTLQPTHACQGPATEFVTPPFSSRSRRTCDGPAIGGAPIPLIRSRHSISSSLMRGIVANRYIRPRCAMPSCDTIVSARAADRPHRGHPSVATPRRIDTLDSPPHGARCAAVSAATNLYGKTGCPRCRHSGRRIGPPPLRRRVGSRLLAQAAPPARAGSTASA